SSGNWQAASLKRTVLTPGKRRASLQYTSGMTVLPTRFSILMLPRSSYPEDGLQLGAVERADAVKVDRGDE
ncbi:hypothetical protein PENTCL1PPCAC_9957, partial [Pristionchus entomophagus]